jgi:hypothetical protein
MLHDDKIKPEGMRKDKGKLKWHLIPVPALLALCKVFHGGALKYDEEQWRGGMLYSRIYRPMISHLNKWLTCKSPFDKELGTHHLMMVAWGCIVLYMYEQFLGHGPKFDDRPDKHTLTEEDFEFGPMPFVVSGTIHEDGRVTVDPDDAARDDDDEELPDIDFAKLADWQRHQ